VGMPVTPGLPGGAPLPGVLREISAIRSLLPGPVILVDPAGPGVMTAEATPTRANVFDRLPECTIVHFACHATSHPSDPSQSMLYLADHESAPLTVRSLEPVQHDQLQLVFLSACSTAYSEDSELLDEAIHLASAFLLVGAPHVIGTLWDVHDAMAGRITAGFYAGLQTLPGMLSTDRAARALHDAVREVRDQRPRVPQLWAGYLHVGT
jgi:CHAT domain-containing protein